MPDARLGFRDNTGEITTIPTQYADGSDFIVENFNSATLYFFDANNFTPLPAGFPTLASISATLEAELLLLIGSSAVIGDIDSVLGDLNLTEVDPVTVFDEFLGATLDTDKWGVDVNGTAAAVTQPNDTGLSVVALNTGTDDDGHATLASDLSFVSSGELLLVEARLRVDDIADVAIEFGVSDAISETGGQAFTSHDDTPVAVASNAAIFGFLADTVGGEVNTNWSALSVNADTAARLDTSVAPVAGTFALLQLALALNADTNEVDASWFINGSLVASATDVVALDTPLYVWLSTKTFEAADAKLVEADYVRATQDR